VTFPHWKNEKMLWEKAAGTNKFILLTGMFFKLTGIKLVLFPPGGFLIFDQVFFGLKGNQEIFQFECFLVFVGCDKFNFDDSGENDYSPGSDSNLKYNSRLHKRVRSEDSKRCSESY
jgi:hypothetical protein